MAQGTVDVTNDIQKRTDPAGLDRLLMVNPATRALQYIETDQLSGRVRDNLLPSFDLGGPGVMTSIGPDMKRVKSNVLDNLTGQYRTFKELSNVPTHVDGRLFLQFGNKFWGDADFLVERVFNVTKMGGDPTGAGFSDVALDRIRLLYREGDKIIFPYGVYKFQNEQAFTKSVEIDFGNSTIYCGGLNGFVFTGVEKIVTSVTADYNESTSKNSLQLANIGGASVGDIIHIYSTELFNTTRTSYRKGGNFLITKITGNTVYFDRTMPFNMAASSIEVRIFNATEFEIYNIGLMESMNPLSGARNGILFYAVRKSSVYMAKLNKFRYNIDIYRSVDITLTDIYTGHAKEPGGSSDGYGVAIESSTRVVCNNVKTNSGQHGITNGGREVSYDLIFNHCTMKAEIWSLGFGAHANVYNMTFNDCTIFGIMLSGNCALTRCKVLNSELITHSNSFYGSDEKRYSNFTFNECEFDGHINCLATNDANKIGSIIFNNCHNFTLFLIGRIATPGRAKVEVSNFIIQNSGNFKITNSDYIESLKIIDCEKTDFDNYIYEGTHSANFTGTVDYLEVTNFKLKRSEGNYLIRASDVKKLIINNLVQLESDVSGGSPMALTRIRELILNNADFSPWSSTFNYTDIHKIKFSNTKLRFGNATQFRNFINAISDVEFDNFELLNDNARYTVRVGSDGIKYRYDGALIFKFVNNNWTPV